MKLLLVLALVAPSAAFAPGGPLPEKPRLARSRSSELLASRVGTPPLLLASAKPLLPAPELVAEAFGTGMITLLGTGVVIATVFCGAMQGLWQISAVWGLAVALAAYTTASVSGAHLNPAVTLALVVFKGFPVVKGLKYMIAQLVGATAAAALNYVSFSKAIAAFEATKEIARGAAGSIGSAPGVMTFGNYGVTVLGATLIEGLQMAILMFIILSLTHKDSAAPSGGACALIGAAVAALVSVYGPLTCGGFNPARAVGPCLVASMCGWGKEAFTQIVPYVAGPLVGGLVGAFAHRCIYAD